MAREFLVRLTLENGQVIGGVFTPLADDDLPRSGATPGGYHAPYVIIDQYGRVTSAAADPTVVFTNVANTFTAGPQTVAINGFAGIVLNGDTASRYMTFARAGLTSWVGFANDLMNFRSLSVGFDPGDPPTANQIYLGGSNASFQFWDAAGAALTGLFGVAAAATQLYNGSATGDVVFRSESNGIWFSAGAAVGLLHLSSAGAATHTLTDAATAAASDALVLTHASSGTPAAGFGSNLRFQLQSSTTTGRDAANVAVTWTTATDATRTGRMALGTYYGSTFQEGLRIDSAAGGAVLSLLGGLVSFDAAAGLASVNSGQATVDSLGNVACLSAQSTTGTWAITDAGDLTCDSVTAGNVPDLVASADLTAQTAAVASVAAYTPAFDGTYRVGVYLTITAVLVDVIQVQVAYTDETSTARTQTFFPQGLTSASLSTTGAFGFPTLDLRVKASTAITVKTVLTTGTGSITYDVGAQIEKLR